MSGSRGRIAKAACLTEWEVRVALDQLIQWGWIEQRHTADHVSVHYRLTAAFAEAVELACEEVSGIVRQYVRRGNAPIEPPACATPMSPDLAEHLRAYAWQHLMQRLLTLNERPKRYGRGYSKPVLRGTAVTLHWFIQAALQQAEPLVASLRGLARKTGLTFRSAKQARARLIAWGLLAEQNGAWIPDYMRLAQLLFEEGAELPSGPAVDRRRGSHRDH
ncbi:MAG: hypothetical protein ACRET7_06145 [Burkholderiales bacterium]